MRTNKSVDQVQSHGLLIYFFVGRQLGTVLKNIQFVTRQTGSAQKFTIFTYEGGLHSSLISGDFFA